MDDQNPREALAEHERELVALRHDLGVADAALRAGADAELPALRVARDRARAAIAEAETRSPVLRAAVVRLEQLEAIDAKRLADEAAERTRRAEEEEARARRDAELEPFLHALADARADAERANEVAAAAEVAREPMDAEELVARVLANATDSERAAVASRIRASLCAEALEEALSKLPPTHPAVRAARALADAMKVHAVIADADEIRILLAASRALAHAALDRVARHPSPPLALGAVLLDASKAPLHVHVAGAHVAAWVGVATSPREAHEQLIAATSTSVPPTIARDEAARLIFEGRAHEVADLGAERATKLELERLASGVMNPARGSVAAARGAVATIAHARRTGAWAVDEETCRDRIVAAADHLAAQVSQLVATQGVTRPFRVSTQPGAAPSMTLPQGIVDDARGRGFTAALSPREQIGRALGLVGDVADLGELVPSIATATRSNSSGDLARGSARPSVTAA